MKKLLHQESNHKETICLFDLLLRLTGAADLGTKCISELPIKLTPDLVLKQCGQGVLCQTEAEAKESMELLSERTKEHIVVAQWAGFGVVGKVKDVRWTITEQSVRSRPGKDGKKEWGGISDQECQDAYLLDLVEQGYDPKVDTIRGDLQLCSALAKAAKKFARRGKSKITDLAIYLIAFNGNLAGAICLTRKLRTTFVAFSKLRSRRDRSNTTARASWDSSQNICPAHLQNLHSSYKPNSFRVWPI